MKTARFTIETELELPVDEGGLTDEGYDIASAFQNAIQTMQYDSGWTEIKRVGTPKYKPSMRERD